MVKGKIVAMALIGASVLAGCAAENDPSRAQPGDCLAAVGEGKKTTDLRIVGCAAPEAAYRVAKRLKRGQRSCGSTTYGYASSGYVRGGGWHLCLTLNAEVGDCFHQEVGFPTGKATKVACGPSATYRIVKRVDGSADKELCGEGAAYPVRNDLARPVYLVYPDPPLTICTDRV
ncbi:hypothetical protein E1292_13510 [Nonomuraea deserti]|uniref:Lipoprotein n=1 Tax=Nonomuraea deserti TaxID=1848322 RepID=A0A4R4VP77_9ACTN|nr:hypothetical protein [Nonomuraea deserti]TDD07512.1 hypothetical protein E1292_13510 [Nonomuraea deserti]